MVLKKGIYTDNAEDNIHGNERQENSDGKNEKKLRRTSTKLLEQAYAGSKEKKQVFKKLDHAEKELENTQQETVTLTLNHAG